MSRLHVPQTHTEMDGTYYGPVCKGCGKSVRWGSTESWPITKCYIAYIRGNGEEEVGKAVEGCAFNTLDEHDKQICRELIGYLNLTLKLKFEDWGHVCYVP
jgi:hypothetical protein